MTKAIALARGYELDALLKKGGDDLLRIMFSGGVIRAKKLQRGSVLTFADTEGHQTQSIPDADQIGLMYESMNLLQRVFPGESLL